MTRSRLHITNAEERVQREESLGEADFGVQGNTFPGERICVEIQVRVGPRLEEPFPVDLGIMYSLRGAMA